MSAVVVSISAVLCIMAATYPAVYMVPGSTVCIISISTVRTRVGSV